MRYDNDVNGARVERDFPQPLILPEIDLAIQSPVVLALEMTEKLSRANI